jgi:CRISPR-associated protein (TIGR03986 family)
MMKHTNPTQPRHDREGHSSWAHAPYNFVPLPEQMVAAKDPLPDLDSYGEGLLTGHIECELTTCSPLYVRGMMTPAEYQEFGEKKSDQLTATDKEKRASFFASTEKLIEGRPAPSIPGSSLRGMIRTLVEVAGSGRMRWVGKEPTFTFRAVAASHNDPLREPYRQVIGALGRNVKAGYLIQCDDDWFVQPALTPRDMGWQCDDAYLKVKEHNISRRDLPQYVRLDDPGYRPQLHHVRFEVEQRRNFRGEHVAVTRLMAFAKGSSLSLTGFMVCSGNMKESSKDGKQTSPRKSHVLMLDPNKKARSLKIRKQAIDDYKAGLTPYQKEALIDWSGGEKDSPNGCLYNLKPVFYVTDGNEIIYFGHSPNFRIPARLYNSDRAATPPDFVPDALRNNPQPDLADAIFGWVSDREHPQGQRAGRVFFSDASLTETKDGVWLYQKPLPLHVLSSPKATTFQHYLVQNHRTGHDPERKETLAHYGSDPATTQIRGYKLYWHRGASPEIEATPQESEHEKQLTRVLPVKPGVRFRFTVHFENLRQEELGALWWALALPGEPGRDYRHKLGMGKPLGMGAVKIVPQLLLSERRGQEGRYGRLLAGDNWHLAEQAIDATVYVEQFEKYVLSASRLAGAERLREVDRIRTLLTMLEWRDDDEQWFKVTSYMEVEAGSNKINEYKERPVLPDPSDVVAGAPSIAKTLSGGGPQGRQTASAQPPLSGAGGGPSSSRGITKTGIIKHWMADKGYGFIKSDNGGQDLFVHKSDVKDIPVLQPGQPVQFEETKGAKGPRARNVRLFR